jgi:hypothetical protein
MSARRDVAARMAEAALRLVDALDDDQLEVLRWPFPSDDERRSWFYTPTDHGGLPLAGMTAPQQRMAFQLMASGLSTAGYVTATTIIGLENVLDQLEGFSASWGRPRGRDPLLYYVRVFGDPSVDGSWSWRIGGHHVSLNFTVVDGELAVHDAVVPRCGSGELALARPPSVATVGGRRGSRPRTRAIAPR